MKVDTWGYEIISRKHLVGECVVKWETQYGKVFEAGYNHQTQHAMPTDQRIMYDM